ncbi:hypothetical protein C8R44DRAFT_748260 [Mycena epipterygia]|nr:hypothetical protein C8R44DRAFT_748260 [Mycena epipterygia]
MANLAPPINAPSPMEELVALLALVTKLTSASTVAVCAAADANRLATEVDAKLLHTLGLENAPSVAWIRTVTISPAALEAAFPAGSRETWSVGTDQQFESVVTRQGPKSWVVVHHLAEFTAYIMPNVAATSDSAVQSRLGEVDLS